MAGRMPNILFVQTEQLTIDVLNAYHRPLALTLAIDRLAASIPTYAHYPREAGYYTSLCGKMHFVRPDQLHGAGRPVLALPMAV